MEKESHTLSYVAGGTRPMTKKQISKVMTMAKKLQDRQFICICRGYDDMRLTSGVSDEMFIVAMVAGLLKGYEISYGEAKRLFNRTLRAMKRLERENAKCQ